jgi:hypothetical protein
MPFTLEEKNELFELFYAQLAQSEKQTALLEQITALLEAQAQARTPALVITRPMPERLIEEGEFS